jgi:transketolase
LTGDLGFGGFDTIRDKFSKRFVNCGAAEIAMLDMAVGLSYLGKIPFVYSITPFLILRCFETLRTYVNHEKLHIILIGSGRNKDYHIDGISHDASDIFDILICLKEIELYFPQKKEEIPLIIEKVINKKEPSFISLKR